MKKFLRCLSLALVCMFLFNITASASNSILPQSSSYIMGTSADIIAESNGHLIISFSISSYGKMSEIGATSIELYENTGSSTKRVATYNSTNPSYSYIMGKNEGVHAEAVTYDGTIGYKYYAKVHLKACDQYGGDSVTTISPTVTAIR